LFKITSKVLQYQPFFHVSTHGENSKLQRQPQYQALHPEMNTSIPIQFGAFKTFAKYSGYPFFHHPTLGLVWIVNPRYITP
jgi:hypothetical protein